MNTTSSIEIREFVVGDDTAPPQSSIIILHGLGADGSDFVPIAQELELSAVGPVRFVFPSAPVRPVSINGGYEMRAWYDIYPPQADPAVPKKEDEQGLRESLAIVEHLIGREMARGMASERIVLMGFSQGCAMTLLAGVRSPNRLAGLVAFSGYLPMAESTPEEAGEANMGAKIFMAHGESDEMVVPQRGEMARDLLTTMGYDVQWHSYPMGHELCREEIEDLNAWLLEVLAVK